MDLECPACTKRHEVEKAAPPHGAQHFTLTESPSPPSGASHRAGITFTPPFDWPATIILAITCCISSIAVIAWIFTLITSRFAGSLTGSGAGHDVVHVFAHYITPLCLLCICAYGGKAAGGVAFLCYKRWGYYCFLPSSVIIGLLNIIMQLLFSNYIVLVLLFISDAVPAYLVYYYGCEHLREMD